MCENQLPFPHLGTAAAVGSPKAETAALGGRDELQVNTSWRGQAAPTGPAPLAPVTRAVKRQRRVRETRSPARPGPTHRTRLTSPFLQLVKRSLVSMAGPGRGAAAPH